MKFGTRIIVRRGSNYHAMNLRDIPGKLIGARGNQSLVLLDFMDGPHDCEEDNFKKWFSISQVRKFDKIVPMEELNNGSL